MDGSNPQLCARIYKIQQENVFSFNATCYCDHKSNSIEVKELHHRFPIVKEEFFVTSFSNEKILKSVISTKDPIQHASSLIKFELLFDHVTSYYSNVSFHKIGKINFDSMRLRSVQIASSPDSIDVSIKKAMGQFNQIIQELNHQEDENYFHSLSSKNTIL